MTILGRVRTFLEFLEQDNSKSRCVKTGNPCGTDTTIPEQECPTGSGCKRYHAWCAAIQGMGMAASGWRGVDLDGTLATYRSGMAGKFLIGDPIQPMVDRIKRWLEDGDTVKIVTARFHTPEQIPLIHSWLQERCNLPPLEVTATKDFAMIELWDDRAVQVIPNTGEPLDKTREFK